MTTEEHLTLALFLWYVMMFVLIATANLILFITIIGWILLPFGLLVQGFCGYCLYIVGKDL